MEMETKDEDERDGDDKMGDGVSEKGHGHDEAGDAGATLESRDHAQRDPKNDAQDERAATQSKGRPNILPIHFSHRPFLSVADTQVAPRELTKINHELLR